MTVSPGLLLRNTAAFLNQTLQDQPQLGPVIGPVAALVAMVAADLDTYVSDRLRRGEQIKTILRAARQVLPADMTSQIDLALASSLSGPEDFSFQRVDAYLVELKSTLISVHAWLDNAQGAERSEAMTDQIWHFAKEEVSHVSRLVPGLL